VAEAGAEAAEALLVQQGEAPQRIGRLVAAEGPATVRLSPPPGWPA
jgi:hypothetical protein